jgi:hypothetical protein
MSMKALSKAPQMTVEEIATLAAAGVVRVLEARQTVGVALSSEELVQVSGGVWIDPLCDILKRPPRFDPTRPITMYSVSPQQ